MKQTFRLFWLMALPMVLGLVSCTSDNIDNPASNSLAMKIQGKWMVAETNGNPVVTNSKQVLTYVSDTKLYYSLSITAIRTTAKAVTKPTALSSIIVRTTKENG